MKAESLKKNIEHFIIEKILNADNCTQYYLDSLKFETGDIQSQCEKIMVTNFAAISQNPKGIKFLMDLPADAFTSLISADNLYITDESIVIKLVRDYLDSRKDLPLLDEENPKKDWSNLNEEEIKKRKEDEAKHQEEENKIHEAAKKAAEDEYNKLDELGKIQHNWNKKVEELHVKAHDRLALKRLTKDQKKELF